jgi:hypothetical protein
MKITMKSKITILLASVFAVGAATNLVTNHMELPAAKVTVRVVDENEQPIANANVWFTFKDRLTWKDQNVRGLTDANGQFTAEGGCDAAGIAGEVTKDGYYMGGTPVLKFNGVDANNHRQPWNETYTVILRPIGKPVALYAKKVDVEIPALDKPCGYDLEAGDWVMPYGKGMKADFIFTLHQERRGLQDYDILGELTFKNPQDGLLDVPELDVGKNSAFRWERQAPESGYETKFQLQNSWHGDKGITRSFKFKDRVWEGYFFRIRTVEQNGQIVSARYGKIKGGIEIFPHDPNPKIVFTYYYNPNPLDRNLEWDMKKDLFGGLTDMEMPREP